MVRLIDADALKQKITMVTKQYKPNAIMERPAILLEDVDEAPTIDAEPIRHGKWIYEPKDAIEMMFTLPKCSECGFYSADGMYYCSSCGARMVDEISNIARESADKISKALEKVRAKGMQNQNIKEDDEP